MNFEAVALNFYGKRYVNYAYFSGIENNSRDKELFFSLLVQRKVVGMQCFRTVTMDWERGFLLLLKS